LVAFFFVAFFFAAMSPHLLPATVLDGRSFLEHRRI